MRIVTLEPYLTEIVHFLGATSSLVAVSHSCGYPDETAKLPRVTAAAGLEQAPSVDSLDEISRRLCSEKANIQQIKALVPDFVLTDCQGDDPLKVAREAAEMFSAAVGHPVHVVSFNVTTLDSMYEVFESVGKVLGKGADGRELTNRIRAQLMDWSDNFYDRMKNKKITVLASVEPTRLAGRWVPDLVKSTSARPQYVSAGGPDRDAAWSEIVSFGPDVILVAPEGYTLEESCRMHRFLERRPDWEAIPAVKRGEVIFSDGITLYRPGPRILDGAGILISAIAGLESGYITPRDSFYRLRWMELHRHKFKEHK